VGQGALARAVGTHDGVHLAGVDVQVNPAQDLFVVDIDPQAVYIQHSSGFLVCAVQRLIV
jgi:hypothetical protein